MLNLKIVNLLHVLYLTGNVVSAVEFRMKKIFHRGVEIKDLFRTFDVGSALSPSEYDTFEHKVHSLKEMPWNKTISQGNRQSYFAFQPNQNLPNVTDQQTVLNLAKMSYDAYLAPETDGWLDIGKKYSPFESFGWKADGVRGYMFADEKNSSIVLALKGTSAGIISGDSPTSTKDKLNDNLMFSCCCARIDSTWHKVCDCYQKGYNCSQTCLDKKFQESSPDIYYFAAQEILRNVQDAYPKAQLWLTGHSLGGGLSGLLGLAYNIPTVTFQSPGDRLPASRLHLPGINALSFQDHIWHFGHNADPIFMGLCQVGSNQDLLTACIGGQ
ncbi:putative lipase atg15 [Entomophthora muscae]|uniref:Lipase atg15 n=1 Tax=Entomophthora muscae TaxID=34485 RepID=A0ACC2TLC3_9FUNG|nr:putative lipase atg15 [Entomophthora muscae]